MIHHVFANRSNIGDWLAARGIQELLASYPITEHLCDEPFVPETLAALSQATPNDLIVIGGGGLFMDYFLPFWEGFLPITMRVPFCLWGVGYCDLKRESSQPPTALLEEIVGRSRFCVVRDELTRCHLVSCALPSPVSCPSLAVIKQVAAPGHGLLHVDNYTTAGADVYEAMEEQGRAFAAKTGRPYRATNNRIPAGREDALAACLRRYELSDLVLSSALHGCIIGVAMGRKVLAVSGDYKIEAFMEAAGLGDWVLGQDDVGELPCALARLSQQPERHAFIAGDKAANRQVAQEVLAICDALQRVETDME